MNKDTLLTHLSVGVDIVIVLDKYGIKKLGDLTNVTNDIYDTLKSSVTNRGSNYVRNEFRKLRGYLHEAGLTFKDEFEGTGLTLENFDLQLDDLNISTTIKRSLRSYFGVTTLGELLTEVDYGVIDRARNMGIRNIRMLKDCLHNIGCSFRNETLLVEEKIEQLRASGALLLEHVFIDNKIYRTLYRHGIFTLDELLNYGEEVFAIAGFGERRQEILIKRMKELNLKFGEPQKISREAVLASIPTSVIVNVSQQDVDTLKQENEDTLNRVSKKELLVAQYKLLYLAKQELLVREAEVDKELYEIVNQVNEYIPCK